MLDSLKRAVDWVFGQTNEQKLNKLRNFADEVNRLGEEVSELTDQELKKRTEKFRDRLESGEKEEDILPEAFAVAREAADRQTEMRPYDVQILGAVTLYQGKIAEMQTGEGKTLVATMPAYLNALKGQTHIATVNDYLAQRDREWMGPIYESLGLKVGALQEDMEIEERREVYRSDIVYGTAAQFGFDYLRDNMVSEPEKRVQPRRDYVIIDEIDSVLIDEARTPLIISGPSDDSTKQYKRFSRLAPRFEQDSHYEIDEKNQQLTLTEEGASKAEDVLRIDDIYGPENVNILHHLKLALRAKAFFEKDEDYIVKDGHVVIVDEFTGRLMPDRRFSDGLHQALEAKEGMLVQRESQTLAQITLQNFFMLYDELAGMTGTAKTEEDEFEEIYGTEVVVIPTNEKLRRDNKSDVIFKTKEGKFKAVVEEIADLYEKGRPVLVGTNSIEKSEKISKMLEKKGLEYNVLNAKNHAREAEIIKNAGQKRSITIATNMAGRGTDIVLGEGVKEKGGLHVIGAQRHESRRIDNQLRGRAGRQGDPGSSQFFLSMEDDLLRIFGGDKLNSLMEKMGIEEGEPIEHDMLTSSIRRAQKKVEGINFERRKQVLKYDKVMARQREAVYSLRNNFLTPEEETDWETVDGYLKDIIGEYTSDLLENYCPEDTPEDLWQIDSLKEELESFENVKFDGKKLPESRAALKEELVDFMEANWEKQKERLEELEEISPQIINSAILNLIDKNWRNHLYAIDDLKEGIGWTSYGGKDPLVEFKRESFELFQNMLALTREEIISFTIKPVLEPKKAKQAREKTARDTSKLSFQHESAGKVAEKEKGKRGKPNEQKQKGDQNPQQRIVEEEPGRNDPCPCGSGKKYKYCCGSD